MRQDVPRRAAVGHRRRPRRAAAGTAAAALLAVVVLAAAPASAVAHADPPVRAAGPVATTALVSVNDDGLQGNRISARPAVSGDGRYVAFLSRAANLVPGDTNRAVDVFVRDRVTGTTSRVSVSTTGLEGNRSSFAPSISGDGRYVAFASDATNLVPGDTNGVRDVFLRDRVTGRTRLVSTSSAGAAGNGPSVGAAISADGRYVAYSSTARNLVPADTNSSSDVFLRDVGSRTTTRISVGGAGTQADAASDAAAISADGRHVAFVSAASNLAPGDGNWTSDVFVRDTVAGSTRLVSANPSGHPGNDASTAPSISADGRYVAFDSPATDLLPGDTNGNAVDVFLRDVSTATTTRVSVTSSGATGDDSSYSPALSADGRYVAFDSQAFDLVPRDTNRLPDVFLRDLRAGSTTRISVGPDGGQAWGGSDDPAISADGRWVAFTSAAHNLVAADINGTADVFLHAGAAVRAPAPAAPAA